MIPLTYHPMCGEHISEAVTAALALAKRKNRVVRFNFNGIRVHLNKRLSIAHCVRQWIEQNAACVRREDQSARLLLRAASGTNKAKVSLNHPSSPS